MKDLFDQNITEEEVKESIADAEGEPGTEKDEAEVLAHMRQFYLTCGIDRLYMDLADIGAVQFDLRTAEAILDDNLDFYHDVKERFSEYYARVLFRFDNIVAELRKTDYILRLANSGDLQTLRDNVELLPDDRCF